MTDYALISSNHTSVPVENLRAFKQGGHAEGWVVPNDSMLIADVVSDLPDSPLNAFDFQSSSGTTVTIDTGEAMVSASPVARDTTTDVNLEGGINNQEVYVGFAPASLDSVTVGVDSDFGQEYVRIPIWSFNTDSSSVTGSTDLRILDEYIDVQNRRYEGSNSVPVDSSQTLDGVDSSKFARVDQNETILGSWNFQGDVGINTSSPRGPLDVEGTSYLDGEIFTFGVMRLGNDIAVRGNEVTGANVVESNEFNLNEDGDGLTIAVSSEGRAYIAPVRNNESTPRFGDEITYVAADNTWTIESPNVEAPNASPATVNNDVVTGDDLRRKTSVTIPLAEIDDNDHANAFISTATNDNVKILRVSMTDEGGTEPPTGCQVRITGEGGGQQQDFATRLTVGTLNNPVHSVGGTGSCRIRLMNNSGSQQELSCHVVAYII